MDQSLKIPEVWPHSHSFKLTMSTGRSHFSPAELLDQIEVQLCHFALHLTFLFKNLLSPSKNFASEYLVPGSITPAFILLSVLESFIYYLVEFSLKAKVVNSLFKLYPLLHFLEKLLPKLYLLTVSSLIVLID